MHKWILSIACGLLGQILLGQDNASAGRTSAFFQYLCADGGYWQAQNPSFDDDAYGFSHFLLHFECADSLSIRADIRGIDGNGDTLLFWQAWEFYTPVTGANHFVQRSPTGIYGIGTASIPNAHERISRFRLQFADGRTIEHKDTHRIRTPNEMESRSYDYNEEDETWVDHGHLIWRRQIDAHRRK